MARRQQNKVVPELISGAIVIGGKSYPFNLSRLDEIILRYNYDAVDMEIVYYPRIRRHIKYEVFDLIHILQPLPNLFENENEKEHNNPNPNPDNSTFGDCPF